jgi:membrane-bound serine protease (ClpP class)
MWLRRTFGFALVCALAFAGAVDLARPRAQERTPLVFVVAIGGVIDLGLAPFVARSIREAEAAGADAVVLEINTFGGRVDAAVAIRDTLLNSPVRTVAFINQRAISAGALIALACETIVMTQGGTIGAAAPVTGGTGESQPAGEKSVSYLRKEFRATAETRNRPPAFAEAMVDEDVVIDGVIAEGKLLTLTTAEALEHKVAELSAPDLVAALDVAGLGGAEIRRTTQTWAESLVRFLTHPVVSSLLMTLGLLGLFVEIRTPGFALPGILGISALGLFFWGHWLVQLAGWEEMLLVVLGLGLLALEVFVLPGTTVAGFAGIIALVAGLGMTLVGAGATTSMMLIALGRVAISILAALAGTLLLLRLLPHSPMGRRLILATGMQASEGYVSTPDSDPQWLGRSGTALSPLRPAGIADIDGTRVDVVSDGAFIDAGAPLVVTRVDGNRIVVRQPHPPKEQTT